MDKSPTALEVIYSATANKEIQAIWAYNAKFYASADQATEYVNFLVDRMERLATDYSEGKLVASNPNLRYILMKRSQSGHGHIAVYRTTKKAVRVVHVFHTSQDWPHRVETRKK